MTTGTGRDNRRDRKLQEMQRNIIIYCHTSIQVKQAPRELWPEYAEKNLSSNNKSNPKKKLKQWA